MFTGIIDHCGIITQIETIPSGLKLWIKHSFNQLDLGESIAVDGICLTVIDNQTDTFCCDLSPETMKLTTAKEFKSNQLVNLERALLPTSRMGGHFVTGHVDQLLNVQKIQQHDEFTALMLTGLNETTRSFILKKGSIAINGVSLTINELTPEGFQIMLIPHTLKRTNLINLKEKDAVNVEFDMLARMIAERVKNVIG